MKKLLRNFFIVIETTIVDGFNEKTTEFYYIFINGLAIFSFVLAVLMNEINSQFYLLTTILLGLSVFLLGLAGLPILVRGEYFRVNPFHLPAIQWTIRGFWARLIGFFICFFYWGGLILLIVFRSHK